MKNSKTIIQGAGIMATVSYSINNNKDNIVYKGIHSRKIQQ